MKIHMTPIPVSLMRLGQMDGEAEKNRIINKVRIAAQGEALTLINLFKKTVATWEDKPRFNYEIENDGNNIRVKVWTDDDIYYFLDQGTMVRYATMKADPVYIPKTVPGWIGSRQGQGGLAFVSRKYPRKGIESRRFTEEIYKERRDKAVKYLGQIITDEISAYWRRQWGGA